MNDPDGRAGEATPIARPAGRERVLRQALPWWLAWSVLRLLGIAFENRSFPYQRGWASDSDIHLYYQWAVWLRAGYVPWRDYSIVYPPGIAAFLVLPATHFELYRGEFLLLAFAVDAAVFAALRRSGRRTGALVWLLAAPLLGPIFWARLDIFVAGALVLACLSLERRRFALAGAAVMFAALLKLWPLLLVPLWWWHVPAGWRRRYLLGAGGVFVVFVAPFVALGGGRRLFDVLSVETHRGIEVESLFAFPLYLLAALHHLEPIAVTFSVTFTGSNAAPVAAISTVAFVLALAGCLVLAWRRRATPLPSGALLLILSTAVITTSKVLSPQYLVWVVGAAALALDALRGQRALLWSGAALLLTTQLQFPFLFERLFLEEHGDVELSGLHAATLIWFALAVLGALRETTRGNTAAPVDAAPAGGTG